MLPTGEGQLKISAYNDQDLDTVREAIQNQLSGGNVTFRIPADRGDLNSAVYRIGDVLEQSFDENDILYEVRINKADYDKMGYLLHDYVQQQ